MKNKRLIAAALLAAIVACSFGCHDDNVETSDSQIDVTSSIGELTQVPIELYTVEMKPETLDGDGYTASLIYPQITGYSDIEIEEKVDALIRSYISRKMNEAISERVGGAAVDYVVDSVDVTYKGDRLFSALLRGSVKVEDDAYTTGFAYGINVDLKGAKLISFDEIVDYKGFVNDFTSGAFELTRGYDKLLDETSHADLIAQYDPLYSIYPEFYIRQTSSDIKLGVVADTINLLGDTAEFESPTDTKKYMKEHFAELTE